MLCTRIILLSLYIFFCLCHSGSFPVISLNKTYEISVGLLCALPGTKAIILSVYFLTIIGLIPVLI